MELKPELLRGVYAYGFERPSAIQQRAIMPIITGRDVIAQAQSGTGKTATFSISILQRVSRGFRCRNWPNLLGSENVQRSRWQTNLSKDNEHLLTNSD